MAWKLCVSLPHKILSNQSKDVCDGGFRLANNIIDRCEAMVN